MLPPPVATLGKPPCQLVESKAIEPSERTFRAQKADHAKGGRIVGKTPVEPKEEYKKIVLKEIGGGLSTARPMSSVIKTISGPTN